MLNAGLVRQSSSGIFSLLPLGLRALNKIEAILDDEMYAIGAQKLRLPLLLAPENWKVTGRYEAYGPDLFRLHDRKRSPFLLSPTHEEEITSLVGAHLTSSRLLPLRLYQVGTKFRDERRPRGGLLRAREFTMKDLYTFDVDEDGAVSTYEEVRGAYRRIFERIGVRVVEAEADSGTIGGNLSHEYHVITPVGEDTLIHCNSCGYAANVERAIGVPLATPSSELATTQSRTASDAELRIRNLLNVSGIESILGSDLDDVIKSLPHLGSGCFDVRLAVGQKPPLASPTISKSTHNLNDNTKCELLIVVLRSGRRLNEVKLRGLPGLKSREINFLDSPLVSRTAGSGGLEGNGFNWPSLGEISGQAVVLLDESLRYPASDKQDQYAAVREELGDGTSWLADRFLEMSKLTQLVDVHEVEEGDLCASCAHKPAHVRGDDSSIQRSDLHQVTPLVSHRAVEVAHTFVLGTRYSEPLGATFTRPDPVTGKTSHAPVHMGCYGVGVTRVLASVVEAGRDDKGVVWPSAVAPYTVCIAPLFGGRAGSGREVDTDLQLSEKAKAMQINNARLVEASERMYDTLEKARSLLPNFFDCVIDDRHLPAGYKLTDAELVGYPYLVIIGKGFLKEGTVEIVDRKTGARDVISIDESDLVSYFESKLGGL
ncbi:prolyl-tRNA synthetase [Gonapodya sp. JEL0774]|nr:prolyl-tRNA synthetase [Gonapodya sp. JEL0774]